MRTFARTGHERQLARGLGVDHAVIFGYSRHALTSILAAARSVLLSDLAIGRNACWSRDFGGLPAMAAAVLLPGLSTLVASTLALLGIVANVLPVTPGGLGVGEAATE